MSNRIVEWARFAPRGRNGYECSSVGDRAFSALIAILPDGRTIEMHYQCDVKGYEPGGVNWRLGKGKPPLLKYTEEELWQRYLNLWRIWAIHHPEAMEYLQKEVNTSNCVLTDRFASTSMSQARALAQILNESQPCTWFVQAL